MLNKDIIQKRFGIRNAVRISTFADQAGLDEHTLSDILEGATKNPGVLTVAKIANALGCSIDELLSDDCRDEKVELKVKLARSCVAATVDLLRQQSQKVSFDELLYVLKTIYAHFLVRKAEAVDVKFAAQHINDFLKNKYAEGASH